MKHLCHAKGCHEEVPPKMLMCGRHWRMVPAHLQKLVWKYYRPGQEIDKRPSMEYLAVMQTAIQSVAAQQAITPKRPLQTLNL
jgi:hypothetical protein